MKKSLLVLTAALSFGAAAAQTAATASAPQVPALTDVPAGHWAKDAIDLLVSKGILLGYPDGTFRGTQNLTRYEAAVIIARLLGQIKTGETSVSTMDEETLTALQNAIQELAADLAALGVRVSDLEENAVSRDDFARLEERVEMLAAASGDAEALAGLTSQIDDLTARADDYDTLRADVDDNASQIAALNDLTVLLNQDILNLQDRVSAVEAAQADLVARADFDALGGRVTTVETKVTSLDNRVTQLEKYAFSISPSLSATYYVARANRNMDLDRLIPGTVFTTGTDGNATTVDTAVDYADLTGGRALVSNTPNGFYGFSTVDANGNGTPVAVEGQTTLSFGITFGNSGKFDTARSDVSGAYVPGPGGLNVNSIDVSFGIRAGLPSNATAPTYLSGPGADGVYGTADDVRAPVYPDVTGTDGTTYRPLFFYFNQATTKFTVGNAPVTVTFGKALKFKFADYIGDNDAVGRGDGYIVSVDGSTLPVIGAFKPMITGVYGSRGGANGDNLYYRGVRAEITPVGTLKAGLNYMQEGVDTLGRGTGTGTAPNDVTAFGADLHGTVAGWQLDSEYATSRIAPSRLPGAAASDVETQSAFYARTSGTLGPVKVYTLNYRTVSAGYDAVAGVMEANPLATNSTAPYGAGRTGFGVKAKADILGLVNVGGYVDNSVAYGKSPLNTVNEPSAIVDRGVAGKVSLFNLVTVRGGYYEYLTGTQAPVAAAFQAKSGVRTAVRADLGLPLGFSFGAFYRNVSTDGRLRANSDGGLFANSVAYNSNEFGLSTSELDSGTCGTATTSVCYSEYGFEAKHNGKDAAALVKGLDLTLGYASRYRAATNGYTNQVVYGSAAYDTKLGVAAIKLNAGFNNSTFADSERNSTATLANTTSFNGSVDVKTDALNTVFKPSFEAYVKGQSKSYDYGTATGAAADFTASDVLYRVGVKLNEFLLPNTKLAVYYAGYQGTNRAYAPYVAAFNADGSSAAGTAGAFIDQYNGNRTVSQDLLYVEGNYYDLSFGYGYGNLRLRESNGAAVAGAADAKGNVFKISYKVKF
ncbi:MULTISPECIES: S-layer homology domain-containing protein [unclassified Deinococcus]|uniref:S-layer homology domain-containing protein n=1 Tax=unclassified Deinococcus TaxID=2623546 RepID=UPI001C30DD9E|nr:MULTISPECIES: S-layer homology domain-containing protein [unclassified Deinococcus]MDK2014152.1 S-layer homology domain-containing protein [Deinococcus sp. 43]